MALVLPHPHVCGHVAVWSMLWSYDTSDSQYEQAVVAFVQHVHTLST